MEILAVTPNKNANEILFKFKWNNGKPAWIELKNEKLVFVAPKYTGKYWDYTPTGYNPSASIVKAILRLFTHQAIPFMRKIIEDLEKKQEDWLTIQNYKLAIEKIKNLSWSDENEKAC